MYGLTACVDRNDAINVDVDEAGNSAMRWLRRVPTHDVRGDEFQEVSV